MIEDRHFHGTRWEALTRLSEIFSVMDLAKISGHRDLRVLQNVYYAPSVEDLAEKPDSRVMAAHRNNANLGDTCLSQTPFRGANPNLLGAPGAFPPRQSPRTLFIAMHQAGTSSTRSAERSVFRHRVDTGAW